MLSLQPFKSANKPSFCSIFLLIVLSWACSLSVAFLPVLPQLEGYFTYKAIFPSNPFFEKIVVDFNVAKNFVKKLLIYDAVGDPALMFSQTNSASTWRGLQAIASNATNHSEYVVASQWIG